MNYVEYLNLFGVKAKEIPCITGVGAPTTSTEGAVGLFYMNTDNGDVYKCVAVDDVNKIYTWELFEVSGEGSVSAEEVQAAVDEYMATKYPSSGENIDLTGVVKSVNGVTPDESGNVEITVSGGNVDFRTDETLTLKDGVLSVNTTDSMEKDNTLPITSAGVFATVGNIEALLKTI